MRLFTGISLPREVEGKLTRLLDLLRPAAQLRWSAAYNLHITTKFIGEWPEARLSELTSALGSLPPSGPFDICVSGLGWLPNPHAPRVLFCGIKTGPELEALARGTEEALVSLGIALEKRPFRPHLTLARMRDPAIPLAALRQHIARLETTDFGCFTVSSFNLYLSKMGPAGSIYSVLAEVPFARQANSQ